MYYQYVYQYIYLYTVPTFVTQIAHHTKKLLWMGAEATQQLQQQQQQQQHHHHFQHQQQQQLQRNLPKARRSICVTTSAPPSAMLNVGSIDQRRHSTTSFLGVIRLKPSRSLSLNLSTGVIKPRLEIDIDSTV